MTLMTMNNASLLAELASMNSIIPHVELPDFSAPVIYLPIRHHSPACAFHVDQVIRKVKPALVLIEGPRDANHLIPYLCHPETRLPVAIYTTFIDRQAADQPEHHGAYYPLAEYSPEFVAIKAANDLGIEARLIDLTFPEMILAEKAVYQKEEILRKPAQSQKEEAKQQDSHLVEKDTKQASPSPDKHSAGPLVGSLAPRSLQEEPYFRHSQLLQAACKIVGARNADDLWDCFFEHHFRHQDSAIFFQQVLAWCAWARQDHTKEQLRQEIHEVREAAMRAEIESFMPKFSQIVVVTGGFHTVALPLTSPAYPKPVSAKQQAESSAHFIRYGFQQLDQLNGYASGMPSPEFYQRLWKGQDSVELLTEVARELRKRLATPSTAEVKIAYEQIKRLAQFRGHVEPTREDFLDGIRSLFIKGSDDVEGVAVLAVTQKYLTGNRVGFVPKEAGRPALVLDFERICEQERISLDASEEHETTLDLYRSAAHRIKSRFFHQLQLLDVPFAKWSGGPDYVIGQHLERLTEKWRYHFQPGTEARLVEQSRYGSTVAEAATAILWERFMAVEQTGQSSSEAVQLVIEACRSGLQTQAPALLERTAPLIADDPRFCSVVSATLNLDLLRVSCEPLEAQHIPEIEELITHAWERATALVPQLGSTSEAEETQVLDDLCSWSTLTSLVSDRASTKSLDSLSKQQQKEALFCLVLDTKANPTLIGAACGLLFSDGDLTPEALCGHLAGFLGAPQMEQKEAHQGARFLRGLLRAARSVCWTEPSVLTAIQETLATLSEEDFISTLPHFRLAFSDFTPKECDRVAAAVSQLFGGIEFQPLQAQVATESEILFGLRINQWVSDILVADGVSLEKDHE